MNFTRNFTYEEGVKSVTAKSRGIDNTPTPEEKQNMSYLAHAVLQPLRDYITEQTGKEAVYVITSWFRSEKLNAAVGGSKTSDHMKGYAADGYIVGLSLENVKKYVLSSGILFDQLIIYPKKNIFHISKRPIEKNNRKEILYK